jgi:hypothetical protein
MAISWLLPPYCRRHAIMPLSTAIDFLSPLPITPLSSPLFSITDVLRY